MLLKFSLFGSALGATAGAGIGLVKAGFFGAVAGTALGGVLGPVILAAAAITAAVVAVGILVAAAIPIAIGYFLLKGALAFMAHALRGLHDCLVSDNYHHTPSSSY